MGLAKAEPCGCGSKPLGAHFGVGAPPILEPVLVGVGMFTGVRGHFDQWPYVKCIPHFAGDALPGSLIFTLLGWPPLFSASRPQHAPLLIAAWLSGAKEILRAVGIAAAKVLLRMSG